MTAEQPPHPLQVFQHPLREMLRRLVSSLGHLPETICYDFDGLQVLRARCQGDRRSTGPDAYDYPLPLSLGGASVSGLVDVTQKPFDVFQRLDKKVNGGKFIGRIDYECQLVGHTIGRRSMHRGPCSGVYWRKRSSFER